MFKTFLELFVSTQKTCSISWTRHTREWNIWCHWIIYRTVPCLQVKIASSKVVERKADVYACFYRQISKYIQRIGVFSHEMWSFSLPNNMTTGSFIPDPLNTSRHKIHRIKTRILKWSINVWWTLRIGQTCRSGSGWMNNAPYSSRNRPLSLKDTIGSLTSTN